MAEDLVEVDEFTPAVTVPEDGDDRDALSVKQGFQPLANRTRNLLNRIGAFASGEHTWTAKQTFNALLALGDVLMGGEVKYADAAGSTVTKERRVQLPLTAFRPWNQDWVFRHVIGTDPSYRGWNKTHDVNADYLVGEFQIPTNSLLVRVQACVTTTSGGSITMSAGQVFTGVFEGDSNGSLLEQPATPITVTNASAQIISLDTASSEHVGWASDGFVSFIGSINGGCTVHWVKATFRDPGPRNY